jgi:hypothetical protein
VGSVEIHLSYWPSRASYGRSPAEDGSIRAAQIRAVLLLGVTPDQGHEKGKGDKHLDGDLQWLFGSSSAAERRVPHRTGARTCPLCGSSQLLTQQRKSTAEQRLDAESVLAVNFTVTQINCATCGKLIDDDVSGITAAAYKELATEAGASPPPIPAMVHEAMQHVTRLPKLSDAERQQDYDQVSRPWDCLGMRHVPATDLHNTLTRIIRGYFAEGATQFQAETLDQGVVMLSFINSRGWRPVRVSRTRSGDFCAYGQTCLYRFLEDRRPKPDTPQGTAPTSRRPVGTPQKQLAATHPVFQLKAGMNMEAVTGLLGRDYLSATGRQFSENQVKTSPGLVHIIDPSILEKEYCLYSDRGHYIEIVFQSGSLVSAEVKTKNAARSETLLARIDPDGLAAAEPYRTALGANQL